jgi:hypothetical protein
MERIIIILGQRGKYSISVANMGSRRAMDKVQVLTAKHSVYPK